MCVAFAVESARMEELTPAFRLMFHQLPATDREARVVHALFLVERGELLREGVLVARSGRRLLGALVCVPLPGASGLVWPPQTADGKAAQAIEDALTQSACAWLRRRGTKLAQVLLPPDETSLAKPLLRNGFQHVTRLHCLHHDLQNLDATTPASRQPQLTFLPHRDGARQRFQQTLLRTYHDTLDCPELNGVRDVAEIIAGHEGQGHHDPERWWLAEEAGQPVGVLLTADVPELGGWDLSYVGVVPEARGRGVGCCLTRKALVEARAAGESRLTLAVDTRNRPARLLYERLGFEATEEREVYLAIL
jgi:ribosomal protein S18 acetylase RimI-like enzyme